MIDVMKECPHCHLSVFHMDLKLHIGVEHLGLPPDDPKETKDEQRHVPIKDKKSRKKKKNYRCKSCLNEIFELKRLLIIHQKEFSYQCGKTMTKSLIYSKS